MSELDELKRKFPKKRDEPMPVGKRQDIIDEQREKLENKIASGEIQLPKINKGEIPADEVATYLNRVGSYVTIRESKEGDVLWYNDGTGIYEAYGDKHIAEFTEAYLERLGMASNATTNYVNQVIGHIQRKTFISKDELNANMDIMVVKNGVIKLATRELLPFDKKYKSTIAIPVNYDTNAVCPQIDKFISEVVEPNDTAILYEMPAWCLIRDSEIQRLVLLLGNGQDGKSKYISLLKAFLGAVNCSSYTLQQLTNNQFAAAGLDGKLANLVADLPSRALYDVGIIKTMTGGDSSQVERKYAHSFDMFNRAKLICVANTPPQVPEDSRAFWRRLIVIEFPFLFEGDKRDPYILDKVTKPEELSGLLNKALILIPKLKLKSDLSYRKTIEDTRNTYNLKSDPARSFIEECCESTVWNMPIKKEAVYQAFLKYCERKGITPIGKKKLGHVIKSERYQEDRDCWMGMVLKDVE